LAGRPFGGVFRIWHGLIKKTWEHAKASIQKRDEFTEKVNQLKAEGRPLVYVDESGFAVDMPRRYGYAPKGSRCLGIWNWHERGRINAIGALLEAGLLTIGLFTSTIDGPTFTAWLTQDLIPKLPPHAVVIMDNAKFHMLENTERLLKEAGHDLLPTPSYSPDLNLIEHTWNEKKALRRKTGCSIDELFM
jgi:transposase